MTVLLRTIFPLIFIVTGSIACQFFPAAVSEASINCYQCHGTSSPVDYRPIDAPYRNITTGGFVGNHRTHMDSPASPSACGSCHPGSIFYTDSHRDGKIKLSYRINSSSLKTPYNNSTSAFAQTATPTLGSCVGVNCHFEAATPVWGSNPALMSCSTCHGAPPSGTASSYTGGAAGSHARHDQYYPGIYNCKKCHTNNATFAHAINAGKRNLNMSFAEAPNNGSGSYTGQLNDYLPSQTNDFGNCTNTYCHSNGTSVSTGIVPANTSAAWGSGALACSTCHGNPPEYINGNPKANSHPFHAFYSCRKCHYTTTNDGVTVTSTTTHVNKLYNINSGDGVSFTYTYNAAGGSCSSISCHGSTTAQWGATSCLSCHSLSQGGRTAVTTQFGGSSHHVQGELTDAKCYQCHWEANSNGSINIAYHGGAAAPGSAVDLVVYAAAVRPTTFSAGVTAVQYTADGSRGEIEKVTNHCLGCHSDQNNDTQPFGDGKTPKQYAWDGTSVAARYAQTGTTTWGKYSGVTNAARKRITKSLSAHGNATANQRGWDTTNGVDGVIANTSGTAAVQCYDCHNSHGSAIAGITSRYSSATGNKRGGLLKETITGVGGYATTYKPEVGGSAADKNVRNPGASICLDCHLNQTATTTPWGFSSTYGATQAVLGYRDAPRYKEYSTSGAEQRYPFKKKNLVKGGHFGASSPMSSSPMASIGGLCTPCHDPHGVSPTLGANQQYAVPLLKGTWLTSPYKEDTAPANNTRFTARPDLGEGLPYNIDQNTFGSSIKDTVTGISQPETQTEGLCLGCHSKESLTDGVTHTWKSKNRIHESVKGWKSANGTVQHNYSCSKCHSPHESSALPRLMVTNCLNGQHKGRTAWSDAKTDDSGHGQAICCIPICTEIPYSFRKAGYANMDGGYGWCASKGNWAASGSGEGRLPGSWRSDVPGVGNFSVACHEGQTGSGTDQAWNEVTPWKIYPQIAITSGPSATVPTPTNYQAIIAWATAIPGSSTIEYGLTTAYGATASGAASVVGHSVTLAGLQNHSTYHYRVKTVASDGQQITSTDATVPYISNPPYVPNTNAVTSPVTCATNCPQTLGWSASADPDGGPVEYQVQVDTANSFSSGNLQTSPWLSATSWMTTLSPNISGQQWYYRVRARDANHTLAGDLPSMWTPVPKNFMILSGPPAAPATGVPTALSTTSIRWNFTDSADNEVGFKLHDGAHAVKASAATANLAYLDESGLAANTPYTRHLHAYNALGDGPASTNVSRYTLPLQPNVTADKTVATWYGTANFNFTNAAGFGAGGVQYYRHVWDREAKYTFTDTETQWSSGTLTTTATADGNWYLHVKSYNGDNVANGIRDYGPFYYDATAPAGLGMTAPLNGAGNLPVQTAVYAGVATDSGVGAVQYQFQIALDSDFTLEVQTGSWQTGNSYIFTLAADKTCFWRVRARDGAGNETAYTTPWSFTTTANSAVWTSKGDFENNLATTGGATNRDKVVVSGAIPTDNAAVTLDFIKISAIAGGTNHSLALKSDGSVWAWGDNSMYQVGDGTYINRFAPVPVPGLASGVIAVAAGEKHSLAVKADGSLWGWGANSYNQLGAGGYYILTPTLIQGLDSGVIAAAGGKYHSLAVKADGSVWAWGFNNLGQLGDGTITQRSTPVQVLPPGSGIIAVAAGDNHSLALKADGSMLAWGINWNYQLGDGTNTQRTTPTTVNGIGSGVVAIAAGASHSLAVKSDGSVWAWGNNGYGAVATANPNLPNPVTNLGAGSGVVAVTAGYAHSLAVKANGAVYAWGGNFNGSLGDNSTQQRNTPVEIIAAGSGVTRVAAGMSHSLALKDGRYLLAWGMNDSGQLGTGDPNRSVPTQVSGLGIGSGTTSVAAGYGYSLAVKANAAVAWGRNDTGQLGDSSQIKRASPVPVSGLDSGVSQLAGGGNFSMALKQDGSVWSWGSNSDGQLGNGTNNSSLTPVAVSSLGSGITAIAAGSAHALAIKPDGSLWSWGYNWFGQLGDGTSGSGTAKSTPLPVPGLDSRVIGIAAGQHHSLALKDDGSVWAWGVNNHGQLGNGTTTESPTPVMAVAAGSGVVRVAAGVYTSFAIKADGSVLAWGMNYNGQLGDGTTTSKSTPTAATVLGSGVIALAGGQDHTLVVKADGSAWAFGRNSYGQLGDGTFSDRTTPVQVTGLGSGVVAVATSYNFSLAIKSDGTALAWGENSTSQLGNGYISPILAPMQNLLTGLYRSPGSIVGLKFDAGSTMNWGSVSWNSALPNNTAVKFRARGGDNEGNLATAIWSGDYTTTGSAINLPASRWLELEMSLTTGDGVFTPTLDDCSITYAPHYTESQPPVGLGNASPVDGAKDVPVASTLAATAAVDSDSGSVQYYFQIARDSAFTTGIQTSSWQTGNSFVPVLTLGNTYYWRVKARDAAQNETPYTAPWSFATPYPPTPPTPGTPEALSTTSLRWHFVDIADNEDGFQLHDPAQMLKAGAATQNLTWLDETGLTANTLYTRHLHAYNALAGNGAASSDISAYTLAIPPNVTTSRIPATWSNAANVIFTNGAGFGSGGLQYYRYVWDQNATYAFSGAESTWSNGTLTATSLASGSWYLHVKSYNGDGIASGTLDLGPYYFDGSPPIGLGILAPAHGAAGLPVSTTLSVTEAVDNDSGAVQYLFQIATNSSFTEGVQNSIWQTSASFAPALSPGITYYWRVITRDLLFNATSLSAAPVWSFTTSGVKVTWTSKGDFENNSTTAAGSVPAMAIPATGRKLVVVSAANQADDAGLSNQFRLFNTTLAGGNMHSLALSAFGTVWTFGSNDRGQLGDGTLIERDTPVAILGVGAGVIGVAAGFNHSLAVTLAGSVLSWGMNYNNQLGDNSTTDRTSPVAVVGFGYGANVVKVSAGGAHSLALKADGSVWAWGYNGSGELGTNDTTQRAVPVALPSPNLSTGVADIAAGFSHSVAVKTDGSVWAWGDSYYGQVGDGTVIFWGGKPVQVSGLGVGSGVITVAAGDHHTLALKTDGSVWAWGDNTFGQLGDNSVSQRNSPVQVTGLGTGEKIVAIKAGGNFSLALKADGSVWGWGSNNNGQLGDNSTIGRLTPVQVTGPGVNSGVIAVEAGRNHSLALKADGSVWAWGANGTGQLGVNNISTYYVPVQSLATNVQKKLFYYSPGTVTNLKLNAGAVVNWGALFWNGSTPANTAIKFRTRGASSEVLLTSASWSGYYTSSAAAIATTPSKWLEVEVTLQTNDNVDTPLLTDFTVTYLP